MNSLDKIQAGLLLVAILLFSSCNDDSSALELEIDNSTDVEVTSFSLPSSTIFLDSLRTDNSPNIFIGNFTDEELGTLRATSYITLTYQSTGGLTAEAEYDSALLQLVVSDLAGNAVSGTMSLRPLIDPLYNSAIYTSEKSLAFEEEAEESFTVDLSELANDSLFQSRADIIGQRLFASIKDSIAFPGYIERFAMVAEEGFQNLVSFNIATATTRLVIFSSIPDSTAYQTVFSLNGKHFSGIQKDFSGTAFEGVQNLDTVEFADGATKVAPLFGFYTASDISQLVDFVASQENILINKAEISVDSGTPEEQALDRLQFFFYKPGVGIRGEGLLGSFNTSIDQWLETAVLDNQTYFSPNPDNITAWAELEEGKYAVDVTIFADVFYSEASSQDNILTEGLVVTPVSFLNYRSTSLLQDPTLKIYYTTIQD
jgi:hypothetical protein